MKTKYVYLLKIISIHFFTLSHSVYRHTFEQERRPRVLNIEYPAANGMLSFGDKLSKSSKFNNK